MQKEKNTWPMGIRCVKCCLVIGSAGSYTIFPHNICNKKKRKRKTKLGGKKEPRKMNIEGEREKRREKQYRIGEGKEGRG